MKLNIWFWQNSAAAQQIQMSNSTCAPYPPNLFFSVSICFQNLKNLAGQQWELNNWDQHVFYFLFQKKSYWIVYLKNRTTQCVMLQEHKIETYCTTSIRLIVFTISYRIFCLLQFQYIIYCRWNFYYNELSVKADVPVHFNPSRSKLICNTKIN